MYANINVDGNINLLDLLPEEAEVLQMAAMLLAESTQNEDHAILLRRAAIELDRQM